MYKIEGTSFFFNKEGDTRILIIPDLHLRASNFKGRYDYPGEMLTYLNNLVNIVKEAEIDIVILLGDVCDNHFTEQGALQYFNKVIAVFKQMLEDCIVITMMGNHDLHNFSTTPFFSITDIHSDRIMKDLKAKLYNPYCVNKTLIAPDRVLINDNTVFELFHFSDINKDYRVIPEIDKTYVGLYHDAIISNKTKSFMKSTVGEQTYNAMSSHMTLINVNDNYFDYLKYACIGDIHTRIGEFTVGNCLVDMPGTVGRTQYTILQGHNVVDLPLFIIDKDSNITKKHVEFNLVKIEDSYKVNMLDLEKNKRVEGKDFKKALERITFTKDIREDIRNADVHDDIKSIIFDAMDDSIDCESTLLMRNYASTNGF